VTNEVNETQMTNLFELWTVDHAPGLEVIPDDAGGLHTVAAPLSPRRVVDQTGRDLTSWLAADDRLIWEPPAVADSAGGLEDELVLTFPRPRGATQAKLITRVGTSQWGSHMIRKLLELRGNQVGQWYDLLDSSRTAVDSVHSWAVTQKTYGLAVEIEGPTGFETEGILGGSGPFLIEKRVMPIDLPSQTGDSIRVRLRMARGFWSLNYLAVDYSRDQPVTVDTLVPLTASGSDGTDLRETLSATDTLYYAMPQAGDNAYLTFSAHPVPRGRDRTVVLHSRGWYRLHLQSQGAADTQLVRRVNEVDGAAAQLSADLYRQWPIATRRHF
jgi:hypothetical protein